MSADPDDSSALGGVAALTGGNRSCRVLGAGGTSGAHRAVGGVAHALIRLLVVSVTATTVLWGAACEGPRPEHGQWMDDPLPPPALVLYDSRGARFDLAAEKGRTAVLLFFGYTHCPDVCPATLADFARALRAVGDLRPKVRFVFVSVDPERDTPVSAERYAWQFDSSFAGFAPTAPQLDSIKAAWGFAVQKETMPGMKMEGYGMLHPAGVFFIARDGLVRFVFAPGTKPEAIASDLRRLLG